MMDIKDTYKTLKKHSEGIYKEKGSKFIAHAYPVSGEDEIKEILQNLRKEYYDARHHCYAYRLDPDMKRFRANDDGEPSSSAGKPILGQLMSNELTNCLVVVIRYFGGTKLGVSGLINAYRTAAADAIVNNEIITKTVNDIYKINFEYPIMNDVMRIIKEEDLNIIHQHFEMDCEITLSMRQSATENAINKFNKVDGVSCEFIRSE